MKHRPTVFSLWVAGLILLLTGAVMAQTITITSPGAGANWTKGQTYTITWTKTGSMDANVRIRLFDSTGTTSILGITDSTPNNGSFSWTIPNTVVPDNYRIRIRTIDNAVYDNSEMFAIVAVAVPDPTITVTSPVAGAQWCRGSAYTITWTKTGSLGPTVRIRLFDPGMTTAVAEIADETENDGSFSWTVPASVAEGNYVVRVKDKNNPVLGNSPVFQIKVCGSGGGTPDWDRIKDILAGMKELQWWRNRPPKFPWPNPCLSCPPEFDLNKIRELLERAGLKERVRVELFGAEGKLSDLGVFGQGLSFGRSFKMRQIGQRHSEVLQKGEGFKLVFKNMAGQIVMTQAIKMKETQGGGL